MNSFFELSELNHMFLYFLSLQVIIYKSQDRLTV